MAPMKAILDRLPTLRNSKDFSTIIPELQDRLSVVEAEADDLKAEREDVLFAAPEKRDAVNRQIVANQTEQDELKAAIAGAERRQKEALFAEQMAGLEKQAAAARKIQHDLHAKYIDLETHFSAAAALLVEIDAGENELRNIHAIVHQHNRNDLIVRSPWWHLNAVLGDAVMGHVNEQPGGTTMLPGYYPRRHPDGPMLERMKEVKL